MPARWGLGPVFVFEWLLASRRWQMYAVRALIVGVLVGALALVWEMELRNQFRFNTTQTLSYKDYGRLGEIFFHTVIGTQLALVLLAAPGAAAGAVCIDKMRGNLLHLLVTDLSAAEIILGKLASRLIPVLGLIACSVPVLMICTLLGGLDHGAVTAAYLVMLGTGVFGTALALMFSVWGRKPHEVLLVVYLVEILWLLAYPIYAAVDATVFKTGVVPNWLRDLNPFSLAFAPYTRPGTVEWSEYGWFLLVTFTAAAACTLLAIVSVRPCTLRHDAVIQRPKDRSARPRRRRGPTLDRNPLLWYEWHRKRPSRWTRAVWLVYTAFAVGGAVLVLYEWLSALLLPGGPGPMVGPSFLNALVPAVGLLLAGVAAVTALADERVRGNLDVLLATPLPTRSIVWAKWRAAFRPVPRLLLLPAFLSALLAWYPVQMAVPVAVGMVPPPAPDWARGWVFAALMVGLFLACGLFLTSLGLALATLIPRVGRAIAYAVGLYAVQCLGWPFIALGLLSSPNGREPIGAALLSPIFAGGVLTQFIQFPYQMNDQAWDLFEWGLIWLSALTAAAVVLYLLALATFDRCMSRIPERGMRPRRPKVTGWIDPVSPVSPPRRAAKRDE
jgi:ABC-type transport system involved in multi-copper enzyme maturation permease subunit